MELNPTIIVALIALAADVLVTVISVNASGNKTRAEMISHQAVQDERLRQLTDAVERHNGFAERVPKLEVRVDLLERQFSRLEDDNK